MQNIFCRGESMKTGYTQQPQSNIMLLQEGIKQMHRHNKEENDTLIKSISEHKRKGSLYVIAMAFVSTVIAVVFVGWLMR